MRLIDLDSFPMLPNKLEGDYTEYERGYIDAQRNMCSLPTIDAVEVVWHKVTTRPLTAEEAEYYAEMELDGIEYIFDCEMPDDGQEILIATKWGTDKDICSNDAEYGIGLEGLGDWEGVYAWAEMPKYEVSE